MFDIQAACELREKYEHFRILVIGRANAGKTTLLKRVCNTDEDPCIYNEKKNLLEPTLGVDIIFVQSRLSNTDDQRGIHDINRPFVFRSNPQFIFHDSPGFETGDESQLEKVQEFIKERARAPNVDEQLHAIWSFSWLIFHFVALTRDQRRFCFTPNKARFLLDVEKKFFNEERSSNVPIIAVFTKFDDFIVQVYDTNLDYETNRKNAETLLKELQVPLFGYRFPPAGKAGVRLESMQDDNGDHQQQVKLLIEKTAESLDDLALKKLFVSVQRSNLELCIEYAVKYTRVLDHQLSVEELVQESVLWFRHAYAS
ncbi:hypothetical protein C0995_005915 [Termitomyces sp. Mi166|nr:hypothetical protein C0995_005915 [Termitomyces sp. Mi166\